MLTKIYNTNRQDMPGHRKNKFEKANTAAPPSNPFSERTLSNISMGDRNKVDTYPLNSRIERSLQRIDDKFSKLNQNL